MTMKRPGIRDLGEKELEVKRDLDREIGGQEAK
jgi:hypothetical protein